MRIIAEANLVPGSFAGIFCVNRRVLTKETIL